MSFSKSKPLIVYHLIPTNQYGGVEVAAQLSYAQLNHSIDYKLVFLKYKVSDSIPFHCHFSLLHLFLNAFSGKRLILVASLWPSYLVSLFFIIFPNIQVVPFYHNSKFVHWKDKLFSLLILFQTSSCLVDSPAANSFILSYRKIISFIIPYQFPFPKTVIPQPFIYRSFDFIFIGRFSPQKRFDLIFPFLNSLSSLISTRLNIAVVLSTSSFDKVLYFRDQLATLPDLNVSCYHNIENINVLRLLVDSKVFVLLSDFEGYSMTLSEAIRAGCVCMVRDLKNYNINFVTSTQTFNLEYESGLFSDSDLIRIISYLTNESPPLASTLFSPNISYVSSFRKALSSL